MTKPPSSQQQMCTLAQLVAKDWGCKILGEFSQGQTNFVARVEQRDGSSAILKIAPPERLKSELDWHSSMRRSGLEVYQADLGRGIALLECLQPGQPITDLVRQGKDDQATHEIAKLIREFSYSSENFDKFPSVRSFATDFDVLEGKVPPTLLAATRRLFASLTQDDSRDTILHGDLHHGNILSSGNEWRAIDPHGYRGPAAFEVAAMIRNPHDAFPTNSLETTIKRRLEILAAELPFGAFEINAWTLIGTMLSAAWAQQDCGTFDPRLLDIAKITAKLV